MNSDVVVEANNLRQRYGDFTAVDGISFRIERGQVFALLGTNGAGKTTTMDLLAGFRSPTGGTVRVFGVDPRAQHRRIATRVGIVLQEAGFFDGLTVRETIEAWRRFHPDPRGLAEALDLVELTDRAGVQVGRLSGGEKRRLDVTLGLLGKPELLLLDEPTTGLDPAARRRIWHVLRDLVAGGLTVVLTTHYMEEAEFLADTAAIVDRGRIVRAGPVAEIIQQAVSRISFRLPDPFGVADLPRLERVQVGTADGRVVLGASDPQAVLPELFKWAADNHIVLSDLEISAGSLEDVFLTVAGHGKES
jgi:ABC-2 type transport system ATP-binding protein